MTNEKVVLIKGKYQFKRQLAVYQDKAKSYGLIKDAVKKLAPALLNTLLSKKTAGDTHYIIFK